MDDKKILLFIRYLTICVMVIGVIYKDQNTISNYTICSVLIYIINSQLRYFVFKDKNKISFISLLIEGILSGSLFITSGGVVLSYVIISILDGNMYLDKVRKIIINLMVCGLMLFMSWNEDFLSIVSNFLVIIILILITNHMEKQKDKKVKAQILYDKLRVSEEKLKKANENLEQYASSIEELTILRERTRISREIHDSVGHSLSTMIIQLRAIKTIAKSNGQKAGELADNLSEFTAKSLDEVRKAVRELKPVELEKFEGILAVEELIKNFNKMTGIDTRLIFSKEKWSLNSEQSLAAYRIVQEFLSNSTKHGKASKINIFMNFNKNSVIITLKDNGQGADRIKEGFGLKGIKERAKELRGNCEYLCKKGEGFILKVTLPRE